MKKSQYRLGKQLYKHLINNKKHTWYYYYYDIPRVNIDIIISFFLNRKLVSHYVDLKIRSKIMTISMCSYLAWQMANG